MNNTEVRNLIIILGDQLSHGVTSLEAFDASVDHVLMAEVTNESTKVWSSKHRIVLFLSAMRHFADELRGMGISVTYKKMENSDSTTSFRQAVSGFLESHSPERIIVTHPGEHAVLREIQEVCEVHRLELEVREDTHFLCSIDDFRRWSAGRRQLRMEYFYRQMRRDHDVLMNGDQPAGGKWNYDSSNREPFGKSGPADRKPRVTFGPDPLTADIIELVQSRFSDHPGNLENFNWPVNRQQALQALDDFIENHLPEFGAHQDAMWTREPFLSHSLLASSLNLKLLDPREVIGRAGQAYRDGHAPLESVEGFVRQVLGWREFVRGIYWTQMPGYLDLNFLGATLPLPEFYWTGKTDMQCLSEVIRQTLDHGYSHHIQRLMVTGLYAMLLGVDPKQVHQWYLAVYVDAVEWVELPNTHGMSQYADGGIMASKPYAATGKYIKRMSNFCEGCRFNPDKRTGEDACPFTVLYWDFLYRQVERLKSNQRMSLQLRNLDRISDTEMTEIRNKAVELRAIN